MTAPHRLDFGRQPARWWPDQCGTEGCTNQATWRLVTHMLNDCTPRGGNTQLDDNGNFESFCCTECFDGWKNELAQTLRQHEASLPVKCRTCRHYVADVHDLIYRFEPLPV